MTAPDEPPDVLPTGERILLVITPVKDPLTRNGSPPRNADYRLKLLLKELLRAYGFKCVECRPASPPSEETNAQAQQVEQVPLLHRLPEEVSGTGQVALPRVPEVARDRPQDPSPGSDPPQ